jgi:hypothetical protein
LSKQLISKETSTWSSLGLTKVILSFWLDLKVVEKIWWSEILSKQWSQLRLLLFIVILRLQLSTLSRSWTRCAHNQLFLKEEFIVQKIASV